MNQSVVKLLLLAFATFLSTTCWGNGQRLKVEGVWDGSVIQVHRIKLRDSDKDARRIRVTGTVDRISHHDHWLQIGPVRVAWPSAQQDGLSAVRAGIALQVDAVQNEDSSYTLLWHEPASLETKDTIKLIGALSTFQDSGEWTILSLSGIPVRSPRRLFRNGRPQLQRLGDRRPDDQLVLRLGRSSVTIGGEFEVKSDADVDRDLDRDDDDGQVDFDQEAQLEAFIDINDTVSAFFELKAELSQRYEIPWERTRDESEVKRGLSWLYISDPLGLSGGLQIGRQTFAETREWWWDDDLDAIRIDTSRGLLRYELALGEELAPESLGKNQEDAEDEHIFRLLARGRLRFSSELVVDLFYLYQNDHSGTYDIGRILPAHREDEVDAKLVWFGGRLSGDYDRTRNINTRYWFDFARVSGKETRQDFADTGTGEIRVTQSAEQNRAGWAIDAGATVVLPHVRIAFLKEPAVTVGYAFGSGSNSGTGTFVQTGLNDNNGKFNGVNRFRYYGELTRPDLSNLGITTLALGFRLGQSSSIEFIHHNYHQIHALAEHPLRIDPDTNARSVDLGNEFDISLGIEEGRHWQLELNASYFIPGAAFDKRDSTAAASFKISFNF